MKTQNMISKFVNAKTLKVNTDTPGDISLGDKIRVRIKNNFGEYATYYKANYIQKIETNSYIINEFKTNLSTKYILPFINIKKKNLLVDLNLINCYVAHCDYNHKLGEYIYLIYRHTPSTYYGLFVDAMKKQSNFLNLIKEKNDERFDCFIFKTNPYLVEDIRLFMKGKYSKFSDEAKKLILDFHTQNYSTSNYYQILNKGHIRKEYLETKLGCRMPDNIDYEEIPKQINEFFKYTKW